MFDRTEEELSEPEGTEESSLTKSEAFAFPSASRTCLRVLLPRALGYSGAITELFDGLKRVWIKLSTHLRETSLDIIAYTVLGCLNVANYAWNIIGSMPAYAILCSDWLPWACNVMQSPRRTASSSLETSPQNFLCGEERRRRKGISKSHLAKETQMWEISRFVFDIHRQEIANSPSLLENLCYT